MHVEGDVLPARAGFVDHLDAAHASGMIAARDQVADLQLHLGLAGNADYLFDGLGRMVRPVARMRGKEFSGAPRLSCERGQLFFG